MKKECPMCQQLFADENLRFCRYDGTQLVSRSARADEAVTIQLSTGRLREAAKRHRKRKAR